MSFYGSGLEIAKVISSHIPWAVLNYVAIIETWDLGPFATVLAPGQTSL